MARNYDKGAARVENKRRVQVSQAMLCSRHVGVYKVIDNQSSQTVGNLDISIVGVPLPIMIERETEPHE